MRSGLEIRTVWSPISSSTDGDALPVVAMTTIYLPQEVFDGLNSAPSGGVLRQHLGYAYQVRSQRDDGRLLISAAAGLAEPDSGHQPVAQTLAPNGVFRRSTLADVDVNGLGRAAVADDAGLTLIGDAQVAQVAQSRSFGIRVWLGHRPRQG